MVSNILRVRMMDFLTEMVQIATVLEKSRYTPGALYILYVIAGEIRKRPLPEENLSSDGSIVWF